MGKEDKEFPTDEEWERFYNSRFDIIWRKNQYVIIDTENNNITVAFDFYTWSDALRFLLDMGEI